MTDLSRSTLQADLERYQQAGDFAAQAETLFQLAVAELVEHENGLSLAQGLYGQAWAAYEQAGDPRGIAKTVIALAELLPYVSGNETMELSGINLTHLYDMGLALFIEFGTQSEQAYAYTRMAESNLYSTDTTRKFLRQALERYMILGDMDGRLEMLRLLIYAYPTDTPEYWTDIQEALHLHRSLDNKYGEIYILERLYRIDDPQAPVYKERILDLYRQLGDKLGEAGFYHQIGGHYRSRDYDVARAALDTSYRLYTQLEIHSNAMSILWQIGLLVLETHSYEAYLRYHEETIHALRALPFHPHRHPHLLFQLLYETARKNRDFATARSGFQQIVAGLTTSPEHQAEHYWQWGRMEAYEAGNLSMGFMLCQWAVTLFQRYVPGQNRYQKKLRIMRREMMISRKKKPQS